MSRADVTGKGNLEKKAEAGVKAESVMKPDVMWKADASKTTSADKGCSKPRYALIGRRLSYSRSKDIHEFLMRGFGYASGSYDLLPMEECVLPEGYRGVNVTNPFKSRIAAAGRVEIFDTPESVGTPGSSGTIAPPLFSDAFFCGLPQKRGVANFDAAECCSEVARQAVNTIFFPESGGAEYYNTDLFGFCFSFSEALSQADEIHILGKGSTSKMVQILARHLQIPCIAIGREGVEAALRAARTADAPLREKRLLVNCTPIGTRGVSDTPQSMGMDSRRMRRYTYFADLTYNPEETLLVQTARKEGVLAKSGLEMLVAQAVMAQEIWNRKTADPRLQRLSDAISATLRELRRGLQKTEK